jgi:hypothetical protein
VAACKWKDRPTTARRKRGRIALQDHGDWVAFRSLSSSGSPSESRRDSRLGSRCCSRAGAASRERAIERRFTSELELRTDSFELRTSEEGHDAEQKVTR